MTSMAYEGDLAAIQRALSQSHDLVARRTALLDALDLRPGERALELGCGGGSWTVEAARFVGPSGHIAAIDLSPDQIETARRLCAELPWVACEVADATALPFENCEFDAVFCNQVIEYIGDLDTALAEARRVLRPGGRLVVLATNWTSLVWYSEAPERMERVLRAWDDHAPYRNLPAIPPARLQRAGLKLVRQTSVTTLNCSYHRHSYGYWIARLIHAFVTSQGEVPRSEADAWLNEFDELERADSYFLSVTPILTEAIRPD